VGRRHILSNGSKSVCFVLESRKDATNRSDYHSNNRVIYYSAEDFLTMQILLR